MNESDPLINKIETRLDQISIRFNQILKAQGLAVKEFSLDRKPPGYYHRTEIEGVLNQVLTDLGFPDLYVVRYSTKPRVVEYWMHCNIKYNPKTKTLDSNCERP
ncbi:hypothetical protein [Limnoraphis robusta]|uniref:Uncharacterized protein n=1 Tax=Limnoraphis robusta CCNP1315 TaxID=3110306 RepID=A0ABU5TSR2_9CYAN|nr:hypothetical protein [Limnoraphis robusta]MEA5517916.1 hypothetical protein [Limnoraphis robusta CCNP1315]MEA5549257.1 hypothetical protein [Limnoraphis robusta CCNP1324]